MADDNNNRKDKEEDQVAEAYESISKKLENLRGSKDEPEEDEEEKPQDKDEEDKPEDEKPETQEKDNDEIDEPLDPLPGTGEKEDSEPKPTFKPRADDPLDNEEVEQDQSSKEEADEYETPPSREPMVARPGSEEDLDDLANTPTEDDSHIPHIKPVHKESSFPQKPDYASEISFSKPSYSEPNPSNYFNRHSTDRPARRGNIWHLIILILIGLAVIGGTVYLLKYQFGTSTPAATPTPAPTVAEPTPEPTPAFDRSQFKVRVLNGTTTSGLAKTVSDSLKELGYQIDKTGNAPKQDFKTSVIKIKASAAALGEELVKDLGSEYSASVSGELKDTDAADAEVTLGK